MRELLLLSTLFLIQILSAQNEQRLPKIMLGTQKTLPEATTKFVLQSQETTTTAQRLPRMGGVKNGTASGRYYGGGDSSPEYEHEYGPRQRILRKYDVPLIDDYICELDATILIVTNVDDPIEYTDPVHYNHERVKRSYYPSEPKRERPYRQRDYADRKYGKDRYDPPGRDYDHRYSHDKHHNTGVVANADRLRCSVIASNDDESCVTCCQLSARRDRSIAKNKIIGFLVDNNQISYDPHPDEGHYNMNRLKRFAPDNSEPPGAGPSPDPRCVCCAPKRYRPYQYSRRHPSYQHPDPY